MEGFNSFYNTIVELMQKSELEETLVGIEPTGNADLECSNEKHRIKSRS